MVVVGEESSQNSYRETELGLFPKDWEPKYDEWKKVFEENKITENSTLIGHSAGCAFILRYLQETNKSVHKVILVAPAYSPGDTPDENNYKNKLDFYNFKIDPEIKNRIKEVVIFTSDNDEEKHIKAANLYGKSLRAQIIKI